MVAVSVGQHDRLDVDHGMTERRDGCWELLELVGISGIDDRQFPSVFDDEPVHQIGTESVNTIGYLIDHAISYRLSSSRFLER